MARNKHPEVTVKRILDTATRLFMEKGYDGTTIQSILDELGDLSKGAIYHHFKSKENVIEAVIDRLYSGLHEQMKEIMGDTTLNGLEKIKEMIRRSLTDPNQKKVLQAAPDLMNNPRFLSAQLYESVQILGPEVLEPVIREGLEDGSIHTDYPKQTAEALMVLANIWLNPAVIHVPEEELYDKFLFMKQLGEKLGVPVLDDDMLEQLQFYRNLIGPREARG